MIENLLVLFHFREGARKRRTRPSQLDASRFVMFEATCKKKLLLNVQLSTISWLISRKRFQYFDISILRWKVKWNVALRRNFISGPQTRWRNVVLLVKISVSDVNLWKLASLGSCLWAQSESTIHFWTEFASVINIESSDESLESLPSFTC